MSGDENDESGVNELMEHRLRSHAIALRFTFSFVSFMVFISSRASLDLSCDFIIRLLHNTQSSKSNFFFQQRQVNYLHRSAAALVATPPQKKAALPLFAVDRKKQRRCCPPLAASMRPTRTF